MTIPEGWRLYEGPRTWKLITGAMFCDARTLRWSQIDGGAYATCDGPIIITDDY